MNNNLVGLKRYTIQQLEPNLNNCMIVCAIISKQKARRLNPRNDDFSERAVWNFTIRDSPRDYINVACWGAADRVCTLSEKFQIGDIIEIQKPVVELRSSDDAGERFHPMVTSPFKLSLNDGYSEIILMRDGSFDNLRQVLRLPTKPIANYMTLSDIHANVASLQGQLVDILVAVRFVRETRHVSTKFGEKQVRDLIVFDYTNPGLTISIWDDEFIARASMWKPRMTILFMTDIKVFYDNYLGAAKGSLSTRTIITEDPLCLEADKLRNFAKDAALQPTAILDQMSCSIPDPSTIQTVMNVRQINDRMDQISQCSSARPEDYQFTAMVYASVTFMDLDGISGVVCSRCPRCKLVIQPPLKNCENKQCTIGMGAEHLEPELTFDVRVFLSDHTGTLTNCRVKGKYAEQLFNCTIEDFLAMTDERKSQLKWKYLMERCCVRLMALCVKDRAPLISILRCDLADLDEMMNKI